MALSTFTELKAAIAGWVNRTDLTSAIPDFIALAEAQISRRLRVRAMIARAEATISTEFFAVPTDFAAPIRLTLEIEEDDISVLEFLAPERFLEMKQGRPNETGEPEFFTVVGGEIQVLPIPDTSYTAELVYYARVPDLASNSTNWLLTAHPDVYLYGSLVQSAPYLKNDERVSVWGELYLQGLADIEKADRVPGGKLRTDVPPLRGTPYNINTDG